MQNSITDTFERWHFQPADMNGSTDRLGDPWGEAMSALFTLRSVLYKRDRVPDYVQYRPPQGIAGNESALDASKESTPWTYEAAMNADLRTLRNTVDVLHRYTTMLRKSGLSY